MVQIFSFTHTIVALRYTKYQLIHNVIREIHACIYVILSFAAKSLEDCSSLQQRTREEKAMTTQFKLLFAGNSATGKTVSKYTTLGKDFIFVRIRASHQSTHELNHTRFSHYSLTIHQY